MCNFERVQIPAVIKRKNTQYPASKKSKRILASVKTWYDVFKFTFMTFFEAEAVGESALEFEAGSFSTASAPTIFLKF